MHRTLLVLAFAAALGTAQTPRFLHAQLENRPAVNLESQLHAAEQSPTSLWWGYGVAGQPSREQDCNVVHLGGNVGEYAGRSETLVSEPLVILFRLEGHAVAKVRFFSSRCAIDADGEQVVWLTGAAAGQSAALLATLARSTASNGALAALAESAGPEAEAALEDLTAAPVAEKTREQAAFWLGAARGHAGFLALQHLARQGGDPQLDRRVAFALSVNHDAGAVPELIRMAKLDASPQVRAQALFWLSHKAGQRAASTLRAAIANDPSTEVKERAVFGLSQLPPSEGVPLLIQVAQTSSNPAVRKRAMFWLGQSHDPRALAFFSAILTH